MFKVEPQSSAQKVHVPKPGAKFKIINKAERRGALICPQCGTASPVDLARLGIAMRKSVKW
jgi:hypothetical protein